MHRIDANAHVSNQFDPGDPLVPRLPTQVDHHWLNAIQEEIIAALTAAGITPVKGTNTQLAAAIDKLNPIRAYGVVKLNDTPGGAVTVRAGAKNLGTPTLISGVPYAVRVPFAVALADANFTPILTDCNTGPGGNPSVCLNYTAVNWTTSHVDVKIYDMTGAEVNPATLSGRNFSIQVLKT